MSYKHSYIHKHAHTNTQVYEYEHADGVGRAHDLVIQGFVRGSTAALFPVVICAGVLYVLVCTINCDYDRARRAKGHYDAMFSPNSS